MIAWRRRAEAEPGWLPSPAEVGGARRYLHHRGGDLPAHFDLRGGDGAGLLSGRVPRRRLAKHDADDDEDGAAEMMRMQPLAEDEIGEHGDEDRLQMRAAGWRVRRRAPRRSS